MTDSSRFTFYEWGNFPPPDVGGLPREALYRVSRRSAPYRGKIVEKYRRDDEYRHRVNVHNFTEDIARLKAQLELPQTDQRRKQLTFLLDHTIRRLAKSQTWLDTPLQEREPEGRLKPSWQTENLLERETRILAKSAQIADLLRSGERLPTAENDFAAWERMKDRDYCGSMAHQRQVEQSGCHWGYIPQITQWQPTCVDLFEIYARLDLMHAKGVPVYAATIWGNYVELVHARFFDRLPTSDYVRIAQFLVNSKRWTDFDVHWAGEHSPAQFEISPNEP